MTRTPAEVKDLRMFGDALHLFPTTQSVAQHNITKLRANGQPTALIKAVHSGPGAAKATTDEAGGLEPAICIAHDARVMLTANLWVQEGLVNGAVRTVKAICYLSGESPPTLPVAVTVKFDSYNGPTLSDGTVPITPMHRTWFTTNSKQCSRLQLPLKLSWAVTIHKSQGMTLDKVVIDLESKEFCPGLTFVAISRVRRLADVLFSPPFDYARVSNFGNNPSLKKRLLEDERLRGMGSAGISTAGNATSNEEVPVPNGTGGDGEDCVEEGEEGHHHE